MERGQDPALGASEPVVEPTCEEHAWELDELYDVPGDRAWHCYRCGEVRFERESDG